MPVLQNNAIDIMTSEIKVAGRLTAYSKTKIMTKVIERYENSQYSVNHDYLKRTNSHDIIWREIYKKVC